jgi:exonuclease III
VWIYAPASTPDADPLTSEWNASLATIVLPIGKQTEITFVIGDFNVAPTQLDCTQRDYGPYLPKHKAYGTIQLLHSC